MPMFTKKPVTIEARRYRHGASDAELVVAWCGGSQTDAGCTIRTLGWDHLASHGDWIIKGIHGRFYPCKPNVFDATYSPAQVGPTK